MKEMHVHTMLRTEVPSQVRGKDDKMQMTVKVNGRICIAPRREHTSKMLGYGARSQGISRVHPLME